MVRAGGEFRTVPAKELARRVVQELLDSTAIPPADVDEIILGNAGTPSDAPNIARVAGLMAGLPESVPGYTVHRNCASGLEAVIQAADRIASGSADLIVAGGVENMSRIPMQLPAEANNWFARWARAKTLGDRARAILSIKPRTMLPESALVRGLEDPVCGLSMGMTAENLAREFGITRQEQDEFALESHRRASAARSTGWFENEIVPVYVGPKFDTMVAQDIGPRENQSLEALSKLRPVFDREHGTVTAGNSCMITDGAAAVLVASEGKARSLGFQPMARIRAHATVGLSPARMGLGPALAIPAALDRAGLALPDVGRFEINEAFAAQVLACLRALSSNEFARGELGRAQAVGEIDRKRLNPLGGAIALGHPIGATGARLIVTLLSELHRSSEGIGIAALCVGGGQGSAIVLERMS
jgi:acetyl-CoA C-acetyltransferase/acetyl-CoA acyltransferase